MRDVIGSSVSWAKGIGFRHAVAQLWAATFETLGNFVNKCRRCWCPTAANCFHARHIEVTKTWVVDEVPALRGNANKVRYLLARNELESFLGIPLVHDDQFQTSHPTTHHDWDTTSDMEERHDENKACWQGIRIGFCSFTKVVDRNTQGEAHER